MPLPASLIHLTITTGDARTSYRSEVGDHAISALAPFVKACPPTPIPGMSIRADIRRKTPGRAVLTLWHAPGASVGMVVLVWTQEAADQTWSGLVAGARDWGLIADTLRRPDSLPWLAVMLAPGVTLMSPEEITMLGDFERCWAWAVLEDACS